MRELEDVLLTHIGITDELDRPGRPGAPGHEKLSRDKDAAQGSKQLGSAARLALRGFGKGGSKGLGSMAGALKRQGTSSGSKLTKAISLARAGKASAPPSPKLEGAPSPKGVSPGSRLLALAAKAGAKSGGEDRSSLVAVKVLEVAPSPPPSPPPEGKAGAKAGAVPKARRRSLLSTPRSTTAVELKGATEEPAAKQRRPSTGKTLFRQGSRLAHKMHDKAEHLAHDVIEAEHNLAHKMHDKAEHLAHDIVEAEHNLAHKMHDAAEHLAHDLHLGHTSSSRRSSKDDSAKHPGQVHPSPSPSRGRGRGTSPNPGPSPSPGPSPGLSPSPNPNLSPRPNPGQLYDEKLAKHLGRRVESLHDWMTEHHRVTKARPNPDPHPNPDPNPHPHPNPPSS